MYVDIENRNKSVVISAYLYMAIKKSTYICIDYEKSDYIGIEKSIMYRRRKNRPFYWCRKIYMYRH
jgi:hypothetical protein